MGAHGHGSFDNDDAADWLQQFDSDGPAAIEAALAQVLDAEAGAYVEAPDASYALAAAEMVAAARDEDLSRLPDDAKAALKEHAEDVADAKFEKRALQAVSRVLRNSELKDLWSDGDDAEAWTEHVRELSERLRG